MRIRLVPFMAIAALSLPVAAGAQQFSQQQSARLNTAAQQPGVSKQPMAQVFVHPELGFSVIAPPGANIAEKAEGRQISIRSPKGFAVNVQAGPTRPDIPLNRMSSLLEARYLGDGKPWSARGLEKPMEIAGLPAHEVHYSGTNSRARVVVARGAVHDYVMIFMAPHHQFIKLGHEFDWMLKNFKPGSQDLARSRAPQAKQVATASKPGMKSNMPSPKSPLANRPSSQRFSDPGFGYEIEYPADWEFNKPAQMAAMFSGREGTPAYAAIIGVQNIQPVGAKSGDEAVMRALNQLKSSLGNAVRGLKVINDAAWTYQRDGRRLLGRQITVTYLHNDQKFRKHLIVIPRPTGTVAHVWSYTAPERQYASFQPIAAKMLSSWRILTADAR